jgi:hemolysin III
VTSAIGYGPRPQLRGVSHRIAFHITLVAGTLLVAFARDGRARAATAVYVVLLAAMYGVSATLHRSAWGPRAYGWLRRADHATIFAAIAGTYTPFSLLGLGGAAGVRLLALAWLVCGLGIVRALVWPHAPRWITSVCYVAAGWVALVDIGALRAALDTATFALIVWGGAVYTLGAVIYLVRRPDPWPAVFGYHEVFHVAIIVASACHFVAIARLAM